MALTHTYIAFLLGLALLLFVSPAHATISLYADANFKGAKRTYSSTVRFVGNSFNDKASSVCVTQGEEWIIFDDADNKGRGETITRCIANLASIGFNDRVSSVKRVN